jgi:hypothetical protein
MTGYSFLLHAHTEGESVFRIILEEVVLHGLLDTLKLVPFLFLTYLFMELLEHKASGRIEGFIKRAGALGPLVGGTLGAVPQCGFSAAAANLYAGRVIGLGTLVAVFLSTSDEMLPILISGSVPVTKALAIVGYKAAVGALVGFIVNITLHLLNFKRGEIDIDEICENDNCHCERGVLYSAIHHTLTISAFILIMTVAINAIIYFVGAENVAMFTGVPFVGHLVAALFGLIPNCAVSVALATLCTEGLISTGVMMSGLFTGAGVGLLVLFRINRKRRENLITVVILLLAALVFGLLADLIPFLAL